MSAQTSGYGRCRTARPATWRTPSVEPLPRRARSPRWRRGFALCLPVGVFCLLMLASCSTVPQSPAVAPRIDLPPPKLTKPQRPEPLPSAPVVKSIWRHAPAMPRRLTA